jgi:putative transposase
LFLSPRRDKHGRISVEFLSNGFAPSLHSGVAACCVVRLLSRSCDKWGQSRPALVKIRRLPFSLSAMARLPRLVVPNQPHHVIQRGNDRQAIVRDEEDCQRFMAWLKECAKFYRVAIHSYVLMPNHVHLLVTPVDNEGLAQMMQKLGRFYVPWFNNKYKRYGSLFQGRFRTSLVDTDRYFLACSRYIELNPVRGHLSANPLDYPWSSYAHHVGARTDTLVSDHPLFWALGNTPFQREASYIALVDQGITPEELEFISSSLMRSLPLGSLTFKENLERTTQRQILPAKRGRPFKESSV